MFQKAFYIVITINEKTLQMVVPKKSYQHCDYYPVSYTHLTLPTILRV